MSSAGIEATSDGKAAPGTPAPGRVLGGHIAFALINQILFANIFWLIPMVARLEYGATDTQTTFVTAAIPTLMAFSIFWNELIRRLSVRSYLLIFWLAGILPLGLIGLTQNYWQMLACHVIACAGNAAWVPVNGKLLKHFYADGIRGRMVSLVTAASLVGGMASIWGLTQWLANDPQAFRIYFPVAAALHLVGLALLMRIAHATGADTEVQQSTSPRTWKRVLRPVLHLGQVLRQDRVFFRYEAAFMTYGAAFMFCEALLPVLATDRLGMEYGEYGKSTQLMVKTAMLVMVLPMGWLHDRIGAVRLCGVAFALLAAYPVLLLLATGPIGVGIASLVFGTALSGVGLAWMLGPVTLAPTPDKVPQYTAIHATLVGVRGVLFQGLGMSLYQLTGAFVYPLSLAAALLLWAAWQMKTLHRLMRTPDAATPPAAESPARPPARISA